MKKILIVAIILAISGLLSAPVFAVAEEWSAASASSLWATPGNWNPVGTPGIADPALFDNGGNGHTTISLGGAASVSNINFTVPGVAYKIGLSAADVLTVANGGYIQLNGGSGAFNQTIQASIAMSPNTSLINFNDGAGLLNVTGNITITSGGAGTLTLAGTNGGNNTISGNISDGVGINVVNVIKNTAGNTWVLSGNNTYSGGTALNAGTLKINSATALGTGLFTINGGKIDNSSIGGDITLANNNPVTFNGDFEFIGTNNLNLGTGATTLTAPTTMTVDAKTLTIGGSIGGGGNLLTKAGAGTLTLTGNNTYIGGTTLNAGTLNINSATALGGAAGVFTINGGKIDNSSIGGDITLANNNPVTFNGDFEFIGTNNLNLGTGATTLTAPTTMTVDAKTLTIGGSIGGGGNLLTKAGAGTLTLTGNNTYIGGTTLNAGTLNINSATALGGAAGVFTINGGIIDNTSGGDLTLTNSNPVSFNGGFAFTGTNNLNLGTGATTLLAPTTITVAAKTLTIGGSIGGGSGLTKAGAGTLTLTGNNTYVGATNINAGTVVAGNASALGNGSAVTVAAGGTLDVGTTNVTVNNTYTQNGTLKVTIASPSSSGKITSNANAAVATTSSVNVTVPNNIFIPAKTTFAVVDGAGGAGVNVPGTITSSDPRLKFSGLSSNGDLFLIVDRSTTGFSSLATNSNTSAVGSVLDNMSTPSADMTTVLNTLEGLSNSQTASALATVTPIVDGGITQTTTTSLNQFIETTTERMEGLYAQARDEETGETGVSTGSDEKKGIDVWGQGFGEYAHQDPRGLSNGYHATIWGTAVGVDAPTFNERVRVGLSGGYASSDINSKDHSGATDIESYQATVYAGYIDGANPYYINGAFSFAYNKYDGSRNIAVGTITRTANADYNGQQYSVLVDGGYTFRVKSFRITPVASLQYLRLHLKGYTETNANALDLVVNRQNYNMLESGLGMKFERPFDAGGATIIPEVHAKWLYDIIDDNQETTSTFSGGGGSFATQGFNPARNALDVGAKLTLATLWSWSLETNYDFEYKEDFTSHTGWADIRYRF